MLVAAVPLTELSEENVDVICQFLDENRKRTINAILSPEERYRSLIADVLSRYLLSQVIEVPISRLLIKRTKYGKPYLENASCYFNVSHSGKWVICAVHNNTIGIDVEYIQPIDFAIAKRFFTIEENKYLFGLPVEKRMDYFYELWALKESYIKMLGRGLSTPLNSFSITYNEGDVTVHNGTKCTFTVYNLDPRYKMAACVKGYKIGNTDVVKYEWNHLFKVYNEIIW
jgi:4'-phosphopantetheinyl transferase